MLGDMSTLQLARNGSKVRQDEVSVRNALPTFSSVSDDVTTLVDSTVTTDASAAVATLATGPTEQAFLQKVIVSGLGATAAGASTLTIAGGEGEDIVMAFPVIAGATLANVPIVLSFDPPLRAAAGDDFTVTVGAMPSGNVSSRVSAIGYKVSTVVGTVPA